jgi:hypothetical protein
MEARSEKWEGSPLLGGEMGAIDAEEEEPSFAAKSDVEGLFRRIPSLAFYYVTLCKHGSSGGGGGVAAAWLPFVAPPPLIPAS